MPSEAERTAFAKACAYLNYSPVAKWCAHLAAVGTGLVYVALLILLWLFADLMVSRGRLPNFTELTPPEQTRFVEAWGQLEAPGREERLRRIGYTETQATDLAKHARRRK